MRCSECPEDAVAKGYCPLHYNRWHRHGDPAVAQRMCPRDASVSARLEILTDRTGGPSACWPFTGAAGRSGYGWVKIKGISKGLHVWAYEEANGAVPEGMVVRHSCDNRTCGNPAHLLLGTHQDNMDDKVARGRQARLCGESNPGSVLTEGDVYEIIAGRRIGVSARALGFRFGVSQSLIYGIAAGRRWAHISRAEAVA